MTLPCAEDPEAWFPEVHASAKRVAEIAKQRCRQCPVKAQCLELALANNEQFGIWGGLSVSQRKKLRRLAA